MRNKLSEKINQLGIGALTISLTVSLCTAVLVYLIFSHLNLVAAGLGKLFNVVYPVLLGIVLAYIVDPLCKFLERRVFAKVGKEQRRRSLSVVTGLLIVIAVIVILLVALIPQLVDSIAGFFSNLDSYVRSLSGLVTHVADDAAARHIDLSRVENSINDLLRSLTTKLSSSAGSIVQRSLSFGSNAVNFFIGAILAIYFLMDKKRLVNGCDRLLRVLVPTRTHDITTDFLRRCHDTLVTFIVFDLLDALMVGAVNFVFMTIARIPYAVLLSIIVGVFNLAPTFGPIAGCLVGALLLLLVNPWYALVFILFTIALQIFDGYIFKPRLFGNKFGVSAIWILVFIIVGGRMFGVVGILLAIPLASIVDYLYHDIVMRKLELRKQESALSQTDSADAAEDFEKNTGVNAAAGEEAISSAAQPPADGQAASCDADGAAPSDEPAVPPAE